LVRGNVEMIPLSKRLKGGVWGPKKTKEGSTEKGVASKKIRGETASLGPGSLVKEGTPIKDGADKGKRNQLPNKNKWGEVAERGKSTGNPPKDAGKKKKRKFSWG